MDSFKSATGLNTDAQKLSGEEPLSGKKGQGTVEEPYDLGNKEGELGCLHCVCVFLDGRWLVGGYVGEMRREEEEFGLSLRIVADLMWLDM